MPIPTDITLQTTCTPPPIQFIPSHIPRSRTPQVESNIAKHKKVLDKDFPVYCTTNNNRLFLNSILFRGICRTGSQSKAERQPVTVLLSQLKSKSSGHWSWRATNKMLVCVAEPTMALFAPLMQCGEDVWNSKSELVMVRKIRWKKSRWNFLSFSRSTAADSLMFYRLSYVATKPERLKKDKELTARRLPFALKVRPQSLIFRYVK